MRLRGAARIEQKQLYLADYQKKSSTSKWASLVSKDDLSNEVKLISKYRVLQLPVEPSLNLARALLVFKFSNSAESKIFGNCWVKLIKVDGRVIENRHLTLDYDVSFNESHSIRRRHKTGIKSDFVWDLSPRSAPDTLGFEPRLLVTGCFNLKHRYFHSVT